MNSSLRTRVVEVFLADVGYVYPTIFHTKKNIFPLPFFRPDLRNLDVQQLISDLTQFKNPINTRIINHMSDQKGKIYEPPLD